MYDESSQFIQPRNLAAPQQQGYNSFRDSSPSNSSNGLSRGEDDTTGFTPPMEYSPYDEQEPIINARSPTQYTPDTPRGYDSHTQPSYRPTHSHDPDEAPPPPPPERGLPRPSPHQRKPSRGFTLTYPCVIPTVVEPVRRVPRKSRPSSTVGSPAPMSPPLPPVPLGPGPPSTSSTTTRHSSALPPGAAPPQTRYG